MRLRAGSCRIKSWSARIVGSRRDEERRILGVIGERLMMKLEDNVRIVRRLSIVLQRRIPTARIPFPGNTGIIESIANIREITRLRRIGVVNEESFRRRRPR